MGCTSIVALTDVSIDCNLLSVGGLKKIFYTTQDNAVPTFDESGDVTAITFNDVSTVKEVSFNTKDGQTSFTDQKTVGAEGSESAIPTLTTFLPSMDASKAAILDELANPYVKLVMFIETASGTKHMIGFEYGMTLASIAGSSGAARPETNGYTLTFTGDEESLASDISAAWAGVLTPVETV